MIFLRLRNRTQSLKPRLLYLTGILQFALKTYLSFIKREFLDASTWWYENGQKECEIRYEDGKENGLCTWWCENGQIECEGFFKDGTEVDDPRTELDENELSSPLSTTVEFIKDVCLDTLCPLLGVWFVIYIFDVWL